MTGLGPGWVRGGVGKEPGLQESSTPQIPTDGRHGNAGAGPVRRLAEGLDRVGRTVRVLLVLRAGAWIAGSFIAAALLIALIDLGLRLPGGVRALLLVAGLGAVAFGVRRLVVPAWRIRPGRASLAHRIEQMDPRHAGQIAPAVDLLASVDEPGQTGALARAGVERAGRRIADVDARSILRWTGVGRSVGALLGVVGVVVVLAALAPGMARIGAARVLAPWTDTSWPQRYRIVDRTGVAVHPMDEALPVRVGVGPGDAGTRVRVEYRIGDERTVTRTPMAPQPGRSEGGHPYERLIDPAGLLDDGDAREGVLRYRIVTPDDRTAWTRVRLVRPPEVVSLTARIDPPAHAAGAPGLAGFRTGERTLHTGDATLGPVLKGSTIALAWSFSSPVRPVDTREWSEHAIDIDQPDASTVVVTLSPAGPVRIMPRVTDEFGLGVRGSVSAGIDARADGLPGVLITEPGSDEIVTPQADLPVLAEAGDDVGITTLRLEGTLMRAPAGSTGAAPEPVGEPIQLASAGITAPVARAEVRARITPASIGAAPGDEIALRAIGTDTRGASGEARSGERRLRVVSGETLAARLRSELGPVSRLLRRADDQQSALIDRVRRAEEERDPLVREQVALGDTVGSAARSVRALDRARERNALDDPALESLLRDLGSVLQEAQDAARAAARSIEDDRPDQAQREQRAARDRIGEALSMLDRGEDAFLARRAVSRIREQLAEAQQQTGQVGQRTAGQDAADLSQQDRAALEQLASDQADLADRAREALEELTRRAEALERDDPAQAEALRRAAEQGRAGAVGQLIEQAGRQTGENQTGQAQQSQQEALEQLDEMLEQIDAAAGLRDTALRRRLATLIASITQLVGQQVDSLESLATAIGGGPTAGLDAGMIGLRENTLGVIEEASAALAELRLIAENLREAETAQSRAVVRLREQPPALDHAEMDELASLSALERALAEAKKQDEQAAQREQDRKKAALRKAYADALGDQSDLRDESRPLLGKDLTRRERVEARRLAATQRELADALIALREANPEISDAPVFALAHERLDDLMRTASGGLGEAAPPAGVGLDQDQAVAILASLVEVLGEETSSQNEDFQDADAGGDGAGQSGGQPEELIPPIAELRLLRDLQRSAMEMTRRLGEQPEPDADAARLTRLSDLQRMLAERGLELINKMNQPPTPSEQNPGQSPQIPDSPEPSTPGAGSTDEAP